MKESIKEILIQFIRHYDDKSIREIYEKNGWSYDQMADAFLKHNSELDKLQLQYVMNCDCVDTEIHTDENGINFCKECKQEKSLFRGS